jgi:LmbE family N-acetylglucosaminyl deacetylase
VATLEEDIDSVLRRHKPGAVITFDADGLYWHDDHISIHERTTQAVAALGSGAPALYYVTLPGGAIRGLAEAAHARGGAPPGASLWGISPDAFGLDTSEASFRIDVRDWVPRKLAALRCHQTQAGPQSPFTWIDESDARTWLGYELFRRAPTDAVSGDILEQLGEKVTVG